MPQPEAIDPQPGRIGLFEPVPQFEPVRDERQLRAEIGEELAQLLESRAASKLASGARFIALETQACADLIRESTAHDICDQRWSDARDRERDRATTAEARVRELERACRDAWYHLIAHGPVIHPSVESALEVLRTAAPTNPNAARQAGVRDVL